MGLYAGQFSERNFRSQQEIIKAQNEQIEKLKNNIAISDIKHRHYLVLCNTRQGLEQLSNAMEIYAQAKKFKDSDYNKKNYPYAFIVSVLDDA